MNLFKSESADAVLKAEDVKECHDQLTISGFHNGQSTLRRNSWVAARALAPLLVVSVPDVEQTLPVLGAQLLCALLTGFRIKRERIARDCHTVQRLPPAKLGAR